MGSIQEVPLSQTPEPTKVLVIGGAYAGLAGSLNLLDLCAGRLPRFNTDPRAKPSEPLPVEIKIIDERDGYYHLISSPLALASEEYMPKAWIKFDDLPALRAPNISHVHGTIFNVDCERKVAVISDANTGKQYEEKYDYLIAATGLRREWPTVPQALTREAYMKEAGDHIAKVKIAKEGVVVIGGGAVGIEMAAELKLLYPSQRVTLIHSRDKLLSSEPLPDDFKDRTLSVLQESGVEVILNDRVMEITPVETPDGGVLYSLALKDGTKMTTSHVIKAISHSIPSTTYLPIDCLDSESYVKIVPTLNFAPSSPNSSYHFAVGDIASWSGIKRCGAAMFMGFHAAFNIHQQMIQKAFGTSPKFLEVSEFQPMIALAMGKQDVLYGPEEGTTWGETQMEMMFGKDLGWTICWNYLKLGDNYEGDRDEL